MTLVWEASTDDIGVCDYVIYNNQEYFDRTPLTQYSAIGLMPGTHKFEVLAQDLSGNLSQPTSLDVYLQGDEPNAPRNFRVSNIADQRITFAWSPPFADQGKVIEYKFAIVVAGIPLPVPVGLNEYVTIDDRNPSIELKVRLKCLLEGGAESPWIELVLPPRS
ncbi:Chitinase A1 precursor [compost metagenome]